jgi:phenylacetate-CoA ligase
MNDRLMRIYHSLPPTVGTVAASLHGYYLRHWRYGPETERLVQEALERERWSPVRWRLWQEEQLVRTLYLAATRVPYYRGQWERRRRKGDRSSWQYVENWPILEKESVRANPRAFLADIYDPKDLYEEETSGTTGTPLRLWISRQNLRAWYALFEARWRRWYGVSFHDKWGILGGRLVVPAERRRPPFWVRNLAFNQLYLSAYHLAPDLIPYYLDELRREKVQYLFGYTSSLYALAQETVRLGRTDVCMKVVITNAEPLYGFQRKLIARAFSCPVRETYGMGEMVTAAGECEHGAMHLWPEAGWVEIVQRQNPVPRGVAGDLVCTGFANAEMPLIRYRVGDRACLPGIDQSCACGRTLPLIESIEGRIADTLYTADGRILSSNNVDIIFDAELPLQEAQIIQEKRDVFRIRYVPGPGFNSQSEALLVHRLRQHIGPVQVSLEPMTRIPRRANGKFSVVICNLPPEDRPVKEVHPC